MENAGSKRQVDILLIYCLLTSKLCLFFVMFFFFFNVVQNCNDLFSFRILRAWGGAGSRVKVGGATIGTCQDMCPEKELLHRLAEKQVNNYFIRFVSTIIIS